MSELNLNEMSEMLKGNNLISIRDPYFGDLIFNREVFDRAILSAASETPELISIDSQVNYIYKIFRDKELKSKVIKFIVKEACQRENELKRERIESIRARIEQESAKPWYQRHLGKIISAVIVVALAVVYQVVIK